MNSATTFKTTTASSEDTQLLGGIVARHLRGGETIELVGDIGAGKTTFVQGLAVGLGFHDDVPSPTFTISRSYPLSQNRVLHHFDFYRLEGYDIVTDELAEAMSDPADITAVEWPENAEADAVLPLDRLIVSLEVGEGENDRIITITSTGEDLSSVVKGVQHDYRPAN